MFLAATFGMAALLSIRVLPQLGRFLLPQSGEPRPPAAVEPTVPPFTPPVVVPATGALSGEFGLLTQPAPAPPAGSTHPRGHHRPPPEPGKTVTAVDGGVSQGTHISTTKIKGLIPPPKPIKQPTGEKKQANGLKGTKVPGGDKGEEQGSGTGGETGKGTDGELNGKGSGGGGSK